MGDYPVEKERLQVSRLSPSRPIGDVETIAAAQTISARTEHICLQRIRPQEPLDDIFCQRQRQSQQTARQDDVSVLDSAVDKLELPFLAQKNDSLIRLSLTQSLIHQNIEEIHFSRSLPLANTSKPRTRIIPTFRDISINLSLGFLPVIIS